MKKFLLMLATAVVALGFASCSNDEDDEAPVQKSEMKLNVSVSNIDRENSGTEGNSLRAVKTSWVNGDKINIWYEGNTQADPDLVIKYNGSDWTIDNTATTSGNKPAATGSILFVYEGYNDLSKYTKYSDFYHTNTLPLVYTENQSRETTSYTYDGETISFSIKDWYCLTGLQVVITDIDPDDYELKCNRLLARGGFVINTNSIGAASFAEDYYTGGIANADGAAYYFGTTNAYDTEVNYIFTLKKKSSGKEYIYTAKNKTIQSGKFTAIKINSVWFMLD